MNQITVEMRNTLCAQACALRAQGLTIEKISAQLGVSDETLRQWRKQSPDFRKAWEAADSERAEALVDEMDDVCKQALAGAVETRAVGAVLQNMAWRASVMHRERYGEKQQAKMAGGFALVIHTHFDPTAHSERPPVEVRGEVIDAE